MRRPSALLGFTLLAALALSAPARADVTLGSTVVPSEAAPGPCPSDMVIGQATENPATPYKVPATGRITGWQINTAFADAGAPVALVVMRDGGGGSTVAGVSPQTLPAPLPPVATFSVSPPIAVAAGDTLGLFTDGAEVVCYWIEGSVPEESTLFARNAPAFPAAGQFLSPFSSNSPGGYTMNVAATWAPPKKKCEKKKKKKKGKKGAAIAGKRKCKKKKVKKK
jgi:hypothetical protein